MQIERFKELLDEDELRYQIQKFVGSQFGVFISSSESSLIEDTILLEITLTYEAFDRNSYMREEVFDYLLQFEGDHCCRYVSIDKVDEDYTRRKEQITEVLKDLLNEKFS